MNHKKLFCLFFSFFIFCFFPSVTNAQVQWGVYTDQDYDSLVITENLEKTLGKKFDNQLYYGALSDKFDQDFANRVRNQGKHLLIVLETWDPTAGSLQPTYKFSNITKGYLDDKITSWANSLKEFGDTIYLSPMSEMNGNWNVWSGTTNGNSPTDFVPAWRHIREIFDSAKVSNVKWVWTPNCVSFPNIPPNDASIYYPGDYYVDYIGINGYNFGPPQQDWISFRDIFMPFYQKIEKITSDPKPIIIGETASSETGGNKATWINEMFQSLSKDFPKIEQVYWFSINKEEDWRIDSSQASLDTFKQNFYPNLSYSAQSMTPKATSAKNNPKSQTTIKRPTTSAPTNNAKVLGEMTNSNKKIELPSNQLLPLWAIIIAISLGVILVPALYLIEKRYLK